MPEELLLAARQSAGPPKRLVPVHVGNVRQTHKGHDTMIRAVAQCKQGGIELELHFLGDVRLRGSFENLAKELGVIEAMARGLPVIASRVGGIPDLVDDDMLITPGDPELLANRITALASDPDLLNEMARRCRENATRFTDERLSSLRHSFYTAVRGVAGNSGSDVA